jgi:hypothetical protein
MLELVRVVPVRLSERQYERLKRICDKTGLSASEIIRSSLDGVHLRERPPADLGALYTEINRIGNNINQIARKMNAGLGRKSDVQEAMFLLRKVYEKMEVIADQ